MSKKQMPKRKNRRKKETKKIIKSPIGSLEHIQEQFGLSTKSIETVNTLDDLRSSLPNIVIAKCKNDSFFKQNDFSVQKLLKNKEYVMSIGVYKTLEYDQYNVVNGSPRKNLTPSKIPFSKIYRPYNNQSLNNKKLLVMRTGGIGDLLFILPNLIYLKEKYPTCKIIFATNPQYHSMVENWNCVDKVLTLPFSDIELKSSQYHLCFEGVIERTREAEKTNAYNLFSRWMGLDLPNDKLHPIQTPIPEIKDKVMNLLQDKFAIDLTEDKLCAIQLKASSPIRTPHPEQFWLPIIRIIISRGYKILIIDNPKISHQIDSIIKKYFHMYEDKVFNFSKYSENISYAVALADIVDVVVGTDSSLVHIAESVGTKNYGIYGPFPGHVRVSNYRYGKWIDCEAECSPCFTHGHKPCIHGGENGGCSPCYNNIDRTEFKENFIELTENV